MEQSIEPPSEVWVFRRGDAGWIWQRLSVDQEPLMESRTAFENIDECVKDASRYGYVPA